MNYKLTKSKYIKGLQCEKALYLDVYFKHLSVITPETKEKFRRGREFEAQFKASFTNSVALDKLFGWQIKKYAPATQHLLSEREETTLFEAAFIHNEVLVLTDVLCKNNNAITIYEVKSATELTDVIFQDISIQYYVCKFNLKNISSFNVVLNDGNGGFNIVELIGKLQDNDEPIVQNIEHFKRVLSSEKEPSIETGTHCNYPYECEFKQYCSKARTLFS